MDADRQMITDAKVHMDHLPMSQWCTEIPPMRVLPLSYWLGSNEDVSLFFQAMP